MLVAMPSRAAITWLRSALPSFAGGVPTAIKQSLASFKPTAMSVENESLPSL